MALNGLIFISKTCRIVVGVSLALKLVTITGKLGLRGLISVMFPAAVDFTSSDQRIRVYFSVLLVFS
jgi:hypothetical protein